MIPSDKRLAMVSRFFIDPLIASFAQTQQLHTATQAELVPIAKKAATSHGSTAIGCYVLIVDSSAAGAKTTQPLWRRRSSFIVAMFVGTQTHLVPTMCMLLLLFVAVKTACGSERLKGTWSVTIFHPSAGTHSMLFRVNFSPGSTGQ